MGRLIDADVALKRIDDYYEMLKRTGKPSRGMTAVMQNIKTIVNSLPTVDAVPSEMLYDFIRGIGAITYGKERFFREETGVWYDRKTHKWITTQEAIEECLKAVRELDDGDIDAEPVRHGKWILGKCNRCGEHAPFWSMATTYYESNFCPNCGARMDKEDDTKRD